MRETSRSKLFNVRSVVMAMAVASGWLPVCKAGDLDETPGLSWSTDTTSDTPEFNRKFRGEFSNQDVVAKLEKMPAHDYLQISFQLFILRSWDGMARSNNGGRSRMGPDFIRVGLDDGRTLTHAIFSNTPVYPGFHPDGPYQTYPSPMPGDRSAYMTGADLKNSLGYFFFSDPHPPEPIREDAVYTLRLLVPHSADKVAIHFRGMGLQAITDESWGVADLKITTLAKAAGPTNTPGSTNMMLVGGGGLMSVVNVPDAEGMAKLLKTASGHDAIAANSAYWQLVKAGDATAEYLAKNTKPRALDAAKVKELATRIYEDAAPKNETDPRIKELLALGPTIEPAVRALRDESAESPSRLDWALMEITSTPIEDDDLRQWMIATRLLDAIATQRAREVLKKLAGG